MSYVEVLTDHGLTVEQWDNNIFSEYIGQLWWKNVMGTSTNAVIQVKEDLIKKPGDAITIGLRGLMQGGKVTGNARGLGNEGSVDFFYQRIVIDNVRHLIKFMDVPMTEKRVGFDVLQEGKEALEEKGRIDLDETITSSLSDITAGRVQGRYLYGAADSNYNATHATALATIDNTADKFSSSLIEIAKRKARIPVNATARIRPMKVKNGMNFEEWFYLVAHTYAIRDLKNFDAAWKNAQLNIPPQANSSSPLFTGTSFVGSWDGVLVYEYDRIQLATNSNSVQTAHNLLCGAQAGAVVWGQRSKFGEQADDLGHEVSYEIHEIRGVSKLVFSRATPEDNGVVHVFSAAVAD